MLEIHIDMRLTNETTEYKTFDIQIRIVEINDEFQIMLKAGATDDADGIDEERISELIGRKA